MKLFITISVLLATIASAKEPDYTSRSCIEKTLKAHDYNSCNDSCYANFSERKDTVKICYEICSEKFEKGSEDLIVGKDECHLLPKPETQKVSADGDEPVSELRIGAASDPQAATSLGSLTAKQQKELGKYKSTQALLDVLRKVPGNPNRFEKNVLYFMRNLKIAQKVKGGYLIGADPVVWSSGNTMEFDMAFLKTSKKLTQDVLITGVVYYAGPYNYTGMNGFRQSVPLLQIPAGLPLSGIHPDGDPFKPEKF